MKNIAFKGDGTDETGKIIIKELQKLGGVHTGSYYGNGISYYFINNKNKIDYNDFLPESYTLIDINNYNTSVPTNVIDSLFDDITKLENIMKIFNDDINIKISDIKKRIQKIINDKQ